MDLTQKKLSKSEWNNIEVPFPEEEKSILKMIINGFHNIHIKDNNSTSLLSIMKLDPYTIGLEIYLYQKYFESTIKNLVKTYSSIIGKYNNKSVEKDQKIKLKKKDLMRIQLLDDKKEQKYNKVFENILLEYCTNILKSLHNRSDKYAFYLYTLIQIKKSSIRLLNQYVIHFTDFVVSKIIEKLNMKDVLKQAYTFIEKNPDLLKYEDNVLYKHQKDIFELFNYSYEKDNSKEDEIVNKFTALQNMKPKLVLYTAPTGTGKTLTPLGLSEGYRIIFICAARHVGLALAKSAVCMGKRVAIAFGCETADDIRLHYFAASEYSVNRRTGGIGKVNNLVGDKVEIMICDIKSYIIAMHYMMAFTPCIKTNEYLKEEIQNVQYKIEYLDRLQNNFEDLWQPLSEMSPSSAHNIFLERLMKENYILRKACQDVNAYNNMHEDDCDYEKVDKLSNQIEILQNIINFVNKISDINYKDVIVNNTRELHQKRVDLVKQMVQYKRDIDIITYWDEPTISMDYNEHPLHDLIKDVWSKNVISKVVLSCATLPHADDIQDTLNAFQLKFENSEINTITSFDCKKSIAILDENCKSALPHLLYSDFNELQECVIHCNKNKSLLRYFDLTEVVSFIDKIHVKNAIEDHLKMENYFDNDISNITMNSLKQYYLHLLKHVSQSKWCDIHDELVLNQKSKFHENTNLRKFRSVENATVKREGTPLSRMQSISVGENYQQKVNAPSNITGLQITTTDAQTLTDGPTIFLANNIENIGKYYIKQTNLPERVFNALSQKIAENTAVQKNITKIETRLEELEDLQDKNNDDNQKSLNQRDKKKGSKSNKISKAENNHSPEIVKLNNALETLHNAIHVVSLDKRYIPNTNEHQEVWHDKIKENAFKPNITDEDVCDIMALDVDNDKKLLLLLGIGMFTNESNDIDSNNKDDKEKDKDDTEKKKNKTNPRYMEIMKKLAYEQNLYVILASSDYIYGTNYQFCHGYIGKDLRNMTQQKTIQAMGRIGRNKMQQEYTIRFRNNDMLYQLFKTPSENKEAIIMNKLFS